MTPAVEVLTATMVQITMVAGLRYFSDTEGNHAVAIQYEAAIAATLS
jgi:hypothetical protein